jgi:hypothetical protein
VSHWKKRPIANHAMRADDCRRHPGMWIEVGIYNSRQSAESTARHIRTAERLRYYTPAGAYETRTELVDDGTALYARYTGAAS